LRPGAAAALAGLCALAAALAGCSGAAPAGPAAQPPAGDGDALALTDCVGFTLDVLLPGPAARGERPPGWAPPRTPSTHVAVDGLRCQRVSLGPLERGPVHLVLESHTNAQPPAACLDGLPGAARRAVLATALADDDGLVAALRARGVPASFAEVSEDGVGGDAPAQAHSWSWRNGTAAASDASSVTVPGDAATQPEDGLQRLFWTAGGGLGRLDLSVTRLGAIGPRVGTGSFQPPMLLGGVSAAGPAAWSPQEDVAGAFVRYLDPSCAEVVH
jgi:hypothetical protein